jgi:hypothetical protein
VHLVQLGPLAHKVSEVQMARLDLKAQQELQELRDLKVPKD